MPYAANGQISQNEIDGGIEISAEQYAQALEGILDGKVVTIDNGFKVDFPAEPEAPPAPPLSLEETKAAKNAEITALCVAAIDAGFSYAGHRYDSDLVSRTNIIGTATGVQAGIPLPEGFTWRTSDNQNVPIDSQGVIALGAALLQHVNEQYATSWQIKSQISAATTQEAVAAISWSAAT